MYYEIIWQEESAEDVSRLTFKDNGWMDFAAGLEEMSVEYKVFRVFHGGLMEFRDEICSYGPYMKRKVIL